MRGGPYPLKFLYAQAVIGKNVTSEIRPLAPATNPDGFRFVHQSASELVSLTTPPKGSESIATVRKNDSVFLLRVYAA